MGRVVSMRLALATAYLLTLSWPGYVFFNNRGGPNLLADIGSFSSGASVLFPLFGLYAFILMANQALIGPNTSWLGRYFVNITHYHRRLGSVAFLLAVLHPLAIVAGYGLSGYLGYDFISSRLAWWTLPGYIGLSLLLATAGVAIINWLWVRISWWKKLHQFNYLVFGLIWLHSWFIGSDVQATGLKYLWIFYLVGVLGSFAYKYLKISHSVATVRS